MKKLFVLCAAAIFVVAFTAPSFAAEWSFYGNARMSTFWEDKDAGDGTFATDDNDLDLTWDLQGNSRIGANVKVSDNLVGRFEYGTGVNMRILWGEYDFGAFKLGVGNNWTPTNMFISNQVWAGDEGLGSYGGFISLRDPMIRFRFGSLDIAFVKPTISDLGQADTDVTFPQIEARYLFKMGGLQLEVGGGYQSYDVVTAADDSESVTSYVMALGVWYNMGPFFIGGNVYTGQNIGNYGMLGKGDSSAHWDAVDEQVLDNTALGYLVVASFATSEMLTFEVGYGYASFDLDDASDKDTVSSYYLQAKITLAKGVMIIPEIGKVNLLDDNTGADEGGLLYYGAKWQINF